MKRFEATLKKRNEENIATKTGTVKLHANVEALLQKQEEDNVPRYMRLTRKQIMRASKVGRQIDSLEAKKREMAEVADKWSKGNETNNKFEETLKARRDDFDKKQKARREREERDEIYQKMKSEQEGLPRYMRRSHNSLTKAASSMRKKGDIIATQTLKMTAVDFDEDGEEIEREPYDPKKRFGKYWGRFSDNYSDSKRQPWTTAHTRKTVNTPPRAAVDFAMLPSSFSYTGVSTAVSMPPTPIVNWP